MNSNQEKRAQELLEQMSWTNPAAAKELTKLLFEAGVLKVARKVESTVPECACCGTTKNLHRDHGSGGPYRCDSDDCIVY